jgi:hypothetical protein
MVSAPDRSRIIAGDAGYRDATNAAAFPQTLAAAVGQGKPYAATEFGCCTFRGAADVAGGPEPVTYDEHGRAAKLTAVLERDEQGQARYLVNLLRDYEAGGVAAAPDATMTRSVPGPSVISRREVPPEGGGQPAGHPGRCGLRGTPRYCTGAGERPMSHFELHKPLLSHALCTVGGGRVSNESHTLDPWWTAMV